MVLDGKGILGVGYYGHGLTMESGIVLELVHCGHGDGQQKQWLQGLTVEMSIHHAGYECDIYQMTVQTAKAHNP